MNDSAKIQRSLDLQEQEHTAGLSDERERELEQEECRCLGVPESIKDSLDRYVKHRIKPGSFARSVLENDLYGALASVDMTNRFYLREIVLHVHTCLPSECHGSKEAVSSWLKEGVTRW